jgi:hypothetical protein
MYSQLNYMIAQQHQAELIQAAERARLIADIKTPGPRRPRTTVLNRIRGRMTAAGTPVTPRADSW